MQHMFHMQALFPAHLASTDEPALGLERHSSSAHCVLVHTNFYTELLRSCLVTKKK